MDTKARKELTILVGGTDYDRAEKIVNSLERNGFSAELAVAHATLSGTSNHNINNLTKQGKVCSLRLVEVSVKLYLTVSIFGGGQVQKRDILSLCQGDSDSAG